MWIDAKSLKRADSTGIVSPGLAKNLRRVRILVHLHPKNAGVEADLSADLQIYPGTRRHHGHAGTRYAGRRDDLRKCAGTRLENIAQDRSA